MHAGRAGWGVAHDTIPSLLGDIFIFLQILISLDLALPRDPRLSAVLFRNIGVSPRLPLSMVVRKLAFG